MARLAAAFASSHSLMLATTVDDWIERFPLTDPRMPFFDEEGQACTFDDVLAKAPPGAAALVTRDEIRRRYDEVQAAMEHLRADIAEAALDALVIVGDDQYELFHDRHMPSIGIYYGATIRNAMRTNVPPEQWYLHAQMRRLEEHADVHYTCDPELALHLIDYLIEAEFDVSTLSDLANDEHEGHAFSFIHRWYLRGCSLPIVPIFLNTYNPPNQPLPRRCVRLGRALRDAIAAFPGDGRIGVMGSGGLSHFVVDEAMDRGIFDAISRKDISWLGRLDPRKLKAGSSEIRAWITTAAAATDLDLDWYSYTPAYRTPALTGTGLGFARWRPPASRSRS